MADIFISYASEDRDRVMPIVKALEEQGWSTWWDSSSIPVGKTWRQFIKEGLEQARCILVIWSKKSISSDWVIEEADFGKDKKILVPALIDDVRPPLGFGQVQAARLMPWKKESGSPEFEKLLKALSDILGLPKTKVIKDDIPAPIQSELTKLAQALDTAIPPKSDDSNLLIATWNLRNFGSLNPKWTAEPNDTPKRDLRGLLAICEIASRFDIIAIQEVMGDQRALRDMVSYLGSKWSFLMTQSTLGPTGNEERMAFVFDTSRLQLYGLVDQVVVPVEWLGKISETAMNRQFVRNPYVINFRRKEKEFILLTLQINYGDAPSERILELKSIAQLVADWANRLFARDQNLITLGDFNIDREGDPLWQAFTSTGLTVPDDLMTVQRSIFDNPNKLSLDKYYDQIGWFQNDSGSIALSMTYRKGGGFDFLPYVYLDINLSKTAISWRISDHYPLWVEFLI
jgi:endonuclease/exonuclease/phosphatase family metal-dependent hydrolase